MGKNPKKVAADEISVDLLHCIREIIRSAVKTLAAVRDPDQRFLGYASMPVGVVRDVQEAYGYSSASVRNFAPSPKEVEQMEVVLPWLAWLRRAHGEMACRRILGWSMGASVWRLAQRERCSERTILNRIDRSVSEIIKRFVGVHIDIEVLEEPYKGASYAMVWEKSPGPHGGEVLIQKVYVGGVGYVKGNRRLRDGTEKYDLAKLSA
jgi:hypothetical protein